MLARHYKLSIHFSALISLFSIFPFYFFVPHLIHLSIPSLIYINSTYFPFYPHLPDTSQNTIQSLTFQFQKHENTKAIIPLNAHEHINCFFSKKSQRHRLY